MIYVWVFIAGMLALIIGPIGGCSGYEKGKEIGEKRTHSEMAKINEKIRELNNKISEHIRAGELGMQPGLDAKMAEFQEWKRQQGNLDSAEAAKRQKHLTELRDKLKTLPIEAPGSFFRGTEKPATEADVRKRFEQWAKREYKKEWRELTNLEDEARKYQKSLEGMKTKASKLGTRAQDQPGYSFTAGKFANVEAATHQRRAFLEKQYVATFVADVISETRGQLSGTTSTKSIPSRISSLKDGVRDRLEDVKSHLDR